MKINVLGTDYEILVKKYDEDPIFKENSWDGYCDDVQKQIVICDISTYPGWEKDPPEKCKLQQQCCIRHELVHAFLSESGLQENAANYSGSWAKFEEMVDWWAIQGPKVYKAWSAAGAI